MQLESLLTAAEVAEWIVYSVQLPSSIGKTFLENGITGYDFLEIVDNGGEVLRNELGIDKVSFRNKIVRQMQTRMLGIGSSPEMPQKLTYKLESCKAITVSWQRSTARVFPVHSYQLQRRSINLFGGGNSIGGAEPSKEVSASNANNIFDSSFNSDWKTVYVGGETEFVDSGLETGHNYMYRIQAWNTVGRSSWDMVDLTNALKRKRCSTIKPTPPQQVTERGNPTSLSDDGFGEGWMSTPKRIIWALIGFIQFIYYSVRFILAFFAMLAGIMRYRRATATSSSKASAALPFPRLWKAINRISKKWTGHELIPRTMVGDREALRLQEKLHDEQIMATGLRGYNRIAEKSMHGGAASLDNGFDRRSDFKKEKSNSTGTLFTSVSFQPPTEVIVPTPEEKKTFQKKLLTWKSQSPNKKDNGNSNGRKKSTSRSVSDSASASVAASVTSLTPTMKSMGSFPLPNRSDHSRDLHRRMSNPDDDSTRCSECGRKFKIGKRYKHHCSRCMATFCHKHGKTTHNNFTSCRVPGDCICNSCIVELSEREARSERSTR
jgi:hypothetical protein